MIQIIYEKRIEIRIWDDNDVKFPVDRLICGIKDHGLIKEFLINGKVFDKDIMTKEKVQGMIEEELEITAGDVKQMEELKKKMDEEEKEPETLPAEKIPIPLASIVTTEAEERKEDKNLVAIEKYMKKKPGSTVKQIAKGSKVRPVQVGEYIKFLSENGMVRRKDAKRKSGQKGRVAKVYTWIREGKEVETFGAKLEKARELNHEVPDEMLTFHKNLKQVSCKTFQKVYQYIWESAEEDGLTPKDIREGTGININRVCQALKELQDKMFVTFKERGDDRKYWAIKGKQTSFSSRG